MRQRRDGEGAEQLGEQAAAGKAAQADHPQLEQLAAFASMTSYSQPVGIAGQG